MRMLLLSLVFLLMPGPVNAAWTGWRFNWDTRTDGDGKPAGIYTTTPFPVDENTTSYTVTNDEGDTVLYTGTIYFIDNATTGCSNGDGRYDPVTRTCGSGSETVYSSISQGVAAVSPGNKTLLVRQGTYNDWDIDLKAGADATHPYSLIGYAQERPVIVGTSSSTSQYVVRLQANNTTLQRVKIQDHYYSGVRNGSFSNQKLIDVHIQNTCSTNSCSGDGAVYAAGSSNGWIFHVTAEKTVGHCIKMSDNANNSLIEWTVAKQCGYWPGRTTAGPHHASGITYPDAHSNHELRYSVISETLMYGTQFRDGSVGLGEIKVHHNEFFDNLHKDDVTGEPNWMPTPEPNLYIDSSRAGDTIEIYGNVIRDGSDTIANGGAGGIVFSSGADGDRARIYNNLIYNMPHQLVDFESGSAYSVSFYNNSLYDPDGDRVLLNSALGSSLDMRNNILYNNGPADCISVGSGTHTYNLYYNPGSGGSGVSLGPGELEGDPGWVLLPSGPLNPGDARLTMSIPGDDLSTIFNVDFLNLIRTNWDMGAFEFNGSTADFMPPMPPTNLGKL